MLTWPFTFTYKWSTTQHDLEPNWTRGEMLIYSLSLSWQFFLFQCLSTFQLEYKYTNLSWMQLNEGAEYSERIVDEYTLHQVFKSDKPKLFLEALSIFSSSYILGSLVQFVSSSCLQTRWQPCLISTGRLSSQGKTRIRSIALQSNYFTLISIYIVIYQGWSGKALFSRHLPSPHTNRFGSLKIPLLGHSSLTERIFFLSPGYWAVDVVAGEPFPAPAGEDQGLLLHLLQAITWAQELDLKVTHIGT